MTFNKAKLTRQLKKHEGLRLESYKDSVGVLTIGYGKNLNYLEITKHQANRWLSQDIDEVVDTIFGFKHEIMESINPARQRVLINMTFNLGIDGILKFKKMWKALERKHYNEAASQMLDSKWATQVGKRAKELAETMRVGRD